MNVAADMAKDAVANGNGAVPELSTIYVPVPSVASSWLVVLRRKMRMVYCMSPLRYFRRSLFDITAGLWYKT